MPALLSPKDLARPAINLQAEEVEYDHSTQTRFGSSLDQRVRPMAVTFNGTQTFGQDGRPKDSDNDK